MPAPLLKTETERSRLISVAPMEGWTSFPMRLWLYAVSQADAMTTPFLRVTRTHPGQELPLGFIPELQQLAGVLPYRLTPQLITADPSQFLRAAKLLPPSLAPEIEINCGCPSPNSLGRLAGSGMLHDPEVFGRSINELCQALGPQRLAVKMRLGINESLEFPALLHSVAQLPLARLTVHGRTRADGYRGRACWASIQLAAKTCHSPVIASGDVLGLASWKELIGTAPGISGAMIGRGVLRNPWVFLELRQGVPVQMQLLTLINALFCYALLHELWLTQPEKMLARVARGRIGHACGSDFAAWEKFTVELTSLVFTCPFLLLRPDSLAKRSISSVALARLRMLWAYLRSGLPPAFANPRILRSRTLAEFFELLFKAGAEETSGSTIEIGHQPEWDKHFAGARG